MIALTLFAAVILFLVLLFCAFASWMSPRMLKLSAGVSFGLVVALSLMLARA